VPEFPAERAEAYRYTLQERWYEKYHLWSFYIAVLLHDVNQEPGHAARLDGLSSIGDGSDKKCANFLGSKLHRSGPGLKPKDCK
jgi:hypothetical protein